MPVRIRLRPLQQLTITSTSNTISVCSRCTYATAATATRTSTPSSLTTQIQPPSASPPRHSPINPPSHRDPKQRRSQLLRSYVSLLKTTPLIILFQHNNLTALQWACIRRELARALKRTDDQLISQSGGDESGAVSDNIKLTVVRTNIFEPALRIAEYYKTDGAEQALAAQEPHGVEDEKLDPSLTHALSENAYRIMQSHRGQHELSTLLHGPIAVLHFPTVSPQHVKTALSILVPRTPDFPAPTRKLAPGYHEPAVQEGLKKLLMLGARVDGQVLDSDGTRWVGSIEGGIDGLRAQLVSMLQGFGGSLAQTLDSASRSLWFTMEGRRRMLEEEAKPTEEVTNTEANKE